MTDMEHWVETFLRAKRAEGASRKTLISYDDCLEKFIVWATGQGIDAVEELTTTHIREYLLYLVQCGHNSGGQHRFYRVLKTFLRWYEFELEPERWKNPIHRVKAPKLIQAPCDPIPMEDIEAMVAACKGHRLGLRDKAILLVLVDTGLRAQELLGLDLADLDRFTGEIQVRATVGKGRKSRTVFLGRRSRHAVKAYLRERRYAVGPLFEKETGGRLTYGGLRQIIRRCAEDAGVEEPTIHAFRRTFTLTMLRNGADLLTIQRLLGHASLVLIARYAKQLTDDLRRVHASASPADRAGYWQR